MGFGYRKNKAPFPKIQAQESVFSSTQIPSLPKHPSVFAAKLIVCSSKRPNSVKLPHLQRGQCVLAKLKTSASDPIPELIHGSTAVPATSAPCAPPATPSRCDRSACPSIWLCASSSRSKESSNSQVFSASLDGWSDEPGCRALLSAVL